MRGCLPVVKRNIAIDVLRGTAILMVLGRHLEYFGWWTKIGWAGVDLFFVLSGFLISGLLFSEWKQRGALDFKHFYIRRCLKIYPAFYFLLLVTVVVNFVYPGISSHPVTWSSFFAEATFTQNYFTGIWGQTWSLGVEEHFYFLLPILLWGMYRRHRHTADPFKALPSLFMVVATVEILLRIANAKGFIGAPGEPGFLQFSRNRSCIGRHPEVSVVHAASPPAGRQSPQFGHKAGQQRWRRS